MANEQTQNQPQSVPERLLEASIKEQEKQVKEQTASKLQAGMSSENILAQLMQSVGTAPTQQDVLGQVSQLAQTPIGTGEKQGILRSLLQGQGLSRPEVQEPLGMGKAIQVMGLQQKMAETERGLPKEQLDFLKGLVDFAKETGNRPLLDFIVNKTSGKEIGKPQLGEEAKSKGRSIPDVGLNDLSIGQTGQGTGISSEGFFETDPMTGKLTPQAEKRQLEIREKVSAETKAGVKQQVDLSQKEANFARVVTSFERAMAQLKGGIEEDAAGGLMKGLWGDFRIFIKRPGVGRARSYDAQVNETVLSMNNILTGQNRVIKGIVQMIKTTFPTRKDPPDVIAQLFTQSIQNAYGIFKAFEKAGFTPEKIRKMTGQELDSIDVQSLVNRLQLTPEEKAERNAFVNRILATPATAKKTIASTGTKVQQNRLTEIRNRRAEIRKQLSQ